MEVQKFHAGRKYRKPHKDLTLSPRFDYNFYKRTPKYNSRVLIGNWYEEIRNSSENYKYHSQTEYQRQFSIKVIPQFKRSATMGEICKQFKHGSAGENKSHDDHYLSTYDLSFKCSPVQQETYSRCEVPMEGAGIGDFGDGGNVEVSFE